MHGKQAHGILSTESDVEEAEYLLENIRMSVSGSNVSHRMDFGIEDGLAISLDSATITYPDDHNRILITSKF